MLAGRSLYPFSRHNLLQFYRKLKGFDAVNRKGYAAAVNTGINFVPQQEAWVVERMGKFKKVLEPGLNLLIPLIDKVKYVQSLKEIAIEIPKQSAITCDNVVLNIDGVLYLKILDPYLASYGVEDPEYAITQLAQTSMRSELGKITLDKVFSERENLNAALVNVINKAAASWGIKCLRYEIKDIGVPDAVRESMQLQVEAERRKRAAILESEGKREADINIASGKRQARILESEAEKQERINQALGEASAMLALAEARAKVLEVIAKSLQCPNGPNAASLNVAHQYVSAFHELAQKGNTVIIPSNVNDVSQIVTQAMAIYEKLNQVQSKKEISEDKEETLTLEEGANELKNDKSERF